jgi:hypothetical protein
MFAWTRPDPPSDFAKLVRNGRIAVACALRHGHQPFGVVFDEAWETLRANCKPVFQKAQQDRCAWCDRGCTGYGMLDHVRPKAVVAHVDPSNPGRELDGTGNIDPKFPRKQSAKSKHGYWWLAFRWSNFVFSCERCNSTWKRSFFLCASNEVDRSMLASPCPSRSRSERAVLLDPYALPSLSSHLCFHANGSVSGTSDEGRATIELVALDRDSLRIAREDVLADVERSCSAFERNLTRWLAESDTPAPPSTLARALLAAAIGHLDDALRPGEKRRNLAGVSRCFLEHRLHDSYESLCAFREELRTASENFSAT